MTEGDEWRGCLLSVSFNTLLLEYWVSNITYQNKQLCMLDRFSIVAEYVVFINYINLRGCKILICKMQNWKMSWIKPGTLLIYTH